MDDDYKFPLYRHVYVILNNKIESGVVCNINTTAMGICYSLRFAKAGEDAWIGWFSEERLHNSIADLTDSLEDDFNARKIEPKEAGPEKPEKKQKAPIDQSVLDRLNDHYYKIENLEHDVEAIRQYRRLDILDAKRASLTELNIKNCSDLLGKLSTDVGYLQGSNRLLQADIKELQKKVKILEND